MSDLTAVISVIAKIAPILASVLPIPGAESIVNLIETAFNSHDNPSQLVNNITNDPDAIVKLKTIETNCEVQLHQIIANLTLAKINAQTAIFQAEVDDVKDARKMVSRTPTVLTYLITSGFFGLLLMMGFKELPEQNVNVLNVMIGSLGSAFMAIVGYWYGKTSTDSTKDAMLYNSVKVDSKEKV